MFHFTITIKKKLKTSHFQCHYKIKVLRHQNSSHKYLEKMKQNKRFSLNYNSPLRTRHLYLLIVINAVLFACSTYFNWPGKMLCCHHVDVTVLTLVSSYNFTHQCSKIQLLAINCHVSCCWKEFEVFFLFANGPHSQKAFVIFIFSFFSFLTHFMTHSRGPNDTMSNLIGCRLHWDTIVPCVVI